MKKFCSKNYQTHIISSPVWAGEYVAILCDKRNKHALAVRFQNVNDSRITGKYLLLTRPQTISALRVSILSDDSERWQWLISDEMIEVI